MFPGGNLSAQGWLPERIFLATVLKKSDLEKAVNDGSRKVCIRGRQAIVPLKFDSDGDLVTGETPSVKLVLKRCTLNDLGFLFYWKQNDYTSAEKACEKAGISIDQAERLARKLACFREEDAKVKALAEIPTASWITAKDVESFYEGGQINESQHKSLDRLAKITGAFKTTEVTITQNVFNLPKYDAVTEAKLKEIADREAMIIQDAQVVNG